MAAFVAVESEEFEDIDIEAELAVACPSSLVLMDLDELVL
jgi:hypothetical protein